MEKYLKGPKLKTERPVLRLWAAIQERDDIAWTRMINIGNGGLKLFQETFRSLEADELDVENEKKRGIEDIPKVLA